MTLLIGLALLVALGVWLLLPSRKPPPAPEDDVAGPIDRAELEQAERELREDPGARPLEHGLDDDKDDWGPGAR